MMWNKLFSGNSTTTEEENNERKKKVLNTIQSGWGSVLEATKHAVDVTRVVVEKETTNLQQQAERLFQPKNQPYKRDLNLPLDVEALRDAEVVYVTDRLIMMGHPYMQSNVDGEITADRKLAAVGHLLERRHGGRYMVYNLSEMEYPTEVLENQVMVYKFPGSPAPPLGLWLKILLSMESWLKADSRNVCVLHCLTGRGRSSIVLAAFLAWMAEAGFSQDTDYALQYICQCKKITEDLTIPSQRRYLTYFSNMLDGVRPAQPPLLLKRIILSEAPKFGRRPVLAEDVDSASEGSQQWGCAPYLQVFKAGALVFTTAATSMSSGNPSTTDDLPFCTPADGAISFSVEQPIQGDILIRCRHLTKKGQRISMFRAAFHTGYVPPKVMRLTKSQIDGACSDKRFSDDFFLDFIFEPCEASEASRHLLTAQEDDGTQQIEKQKSNNNNKNDDPDDNEAAKRRTKGTVFGAGSSGVTITASAYDSMLHRDSRFWDVITQHRQSRLDKQVEEKDAEDETNDDNANNSMIGAVIGRRRKFESSNEDDDKTKHDGSIKGNSAPNRKDKQAYIRSFSIGGGEFDDFMESPKKEVKKESTPKKDDLMDALMAIDDDDDDDDDLDHSDAHISPQKPKVKQPVEEEIVFETDNIVESVNADSQKESSNISPPTGQSNLLESKLSSENEEKKPSSSEAGTKTLESTEVESKVESVCNNTVTSKDDTSGNTGSASYDFVEDSTLEDTVRTMEDEMDAALGNDKGEEEEIILDDDDDDDIDDDDDDDELEDLEKFLTQNASKK